MANDFDCFFLTSDFTLTTLRATWQSEPLLIRERSSLFSTCGRSNSGTLSSDVQISILVDYTVSKCSLIKKHTSVHQEVSDLSVIVFRNRSNGNNINLKK